MRKIARKSILTVVGVALALCTLPALAAAQPPVAPDTISAGKPPSALTASAPRSMARAAYGPGDAPYSADATYTAKAVCGSDGKMWIASPYPAWMGSAEWFQYYTTVAKWNGSAYVPDTSRWQGPIYGHSGYPGWWWTASTGWQNKGVWPGVWTVFPMQHDGAYYRPYTWMKQLTSGRVYVGTAPMSNGSSYCRYF